MCPRTQSEAGVTETDGAGSSCLAERGPQSCSQYWMAVGSVASACPSVASASRYHWAQVCLYLTVKQKRFLACFRAGRKLPQTCTGKTAIKHECALT